MLRFIPINATQAVAKTIINYKKPNKPQNNRLLIYCLDISGSMSGTPITNAKVGIIEALRTNIDLFNDIRLVTYNDKAITRPIKKALLEQEIKEISQLHANMGTNFAGMFKELISIIDKKIVETKGKVDIYIYVFTDGEDSGSRDLEQNRINFNNIMHDNRLINAGGKTWCKARAFSGGVNVPMLEYLMRSGTEEGDFQYAYSAQEIKDILARDELLNIKTISGMLKFPDGNTILLNFMQTDDEIHEAQIVLGTNELKSGLPYLEIDSVKMPLKMDLIEEKCK